MIAAVGMAALLLPTGSASAQTTGGGPWSVEVGVGWDNGIAGHINSSGIGSLDGQAVVVTPNTYEEVYGTGLHLRFGGGYMVNEATEVTGIFIWQTLDADQVTPMGDIGTSNLYGQYSDYQMFGMDFGLRRYVNLSSTFRAYGEGLVGLGFLDKTDVMLVAPGVDLIRDANDLYDQTTAWNAGANVGLVIQTGGRVNFFGQLGLRYVSGMAEVDDLVGTGLETINDKSSRWTLPFVGGVRLHF
jgi:opacity protein-like surface antigen